MTIKRQYSLPNCTLILEGVGDDSGFSAARPPISVIVNAECHLTGFEKPLTGGREFLDSLVNAVSQYAQECLSGIHHPMDSHGKHGLVQLHRIDEDSHRLTVLPHEGHADGAVRSVEPLKLEIKTVQLFDLVEAVDQLCADTQTLPDLTLNLAPLSRRHVVSQEPITKRAVPAALGISSLAVAAGLLFLVPVPQVRRPEPAAQGSTTQESPIASSAASTSSAAGASPPETAAANVVPSPVESTAVSPSPETNPSSEASPSPEASAIASESPSPEASSSSEASSTTVAITDPSQLSSLKQQLRSKLDEAWKTRPSFDEELVYRVSVGQNGDILGYRYTNETAVQYVNQTPLPDLLYNPTEATSQEPTADFRVVFTPGGAVEVSPWYGTPESPNP